MAETEDGSPLPGPAEPPTDAPEKEPLDPALVQSWLGRLKPAVVLALLKDPDLGFVVSRAFLGFRPNPQGYANPLVRGRLVQAAVKDEKLAEKLRALADLETLVQAAAPAPQPPAPALAFPLAIPDKPDRDHALRAERDARRRERDEARTALSDAQAAREDALRLLRQAETDREELNRQVKKQGERIARMERQIARAQHVESRLVKALGQDKVSPPPSPARSSGPAPGLTAEPVSPWLTAVRHLLDRGRFDTALLLADDVLKAGTEDADALEVAARAQEGRGDARAATALLRRLLAVQAARRDISASSETLLRLLRTVSEPSQAEPETRLWLGLLPAGEGEALDAARRMLPRLRGADAEAHGWLTAYIAAQTSLADVLMPPPGALGPDDPLPLPGLPAVSARRLAVALDAGETSLVESARDALAHLAVSDPDVTSRVWAALESASGDDPARLLPLRRRARGPVVVDASNVAWFGQEELAFPVPRLRYLQEMRRALRARGFFPILLVADANLPHVIDDRPALRLMLDRGEVSRVDAGTVADEVLLRTAKSLDAPLVTNDRMEDWDPKGEVVKARYAISPGGGAYLLADI